MNIPYSSVNGIFDKEIGGWHENPFFINGPVREHTDWFTDMLFTIQGIDDVIPAVFNYSRFVCDVERLENDPMEKEGQGIRIVDLLLKEFNSSGYSTALNKPYANTLTPVKDKEYKSVMIEVNKRIYLDAGTLLLNPNPSQCRPAAGFRIPTK